MAVMWAYMKMKKPWRKLRLYLIKDIGKYNILTQVVGGRALIRSELYGKDDAYEYI